MTVENTWGVLPDGCRDTAGLPAWLQGSDPAGPQGRSRERGQSRRPFPRDPRPCPAPESLPGEDPRAGRARPGPPPLPGGGAALPGRWRPRRRRCRGECGAAATRVRAGRGSLPFLRGHGAGMPRGRWRCAPPGLPRGSGKEGPTGVGAAPRGQWEPRGRGEGSGATPAGCWGLTGATAGDERRGRLRGAGRAQPSRPSSCPRGQAGT